MGRRLWRVAIWGALLPVLVSVAPTRTTEAATTRPLVADAYSHLGATTVGLWSRVTGQLTVTDPAVRPNSYDFVAARFMAKQETPAGTRWLEAGWAEVGWSGSGRQRVYTFDTATNTWTFYDQYPLRAGDQISIALAGVGGQWSAALYWHGGWYPLTSTALPQGGLATIEQYVEVYRDPAKPAGPLAVPAISVSQVTVAGPGAPRSWTDSAVPSYRGGTPTGYCVTRLDQWADWSAGTCSPA